MIDPCFKPHQEELSTLKEELERLQIELGELKQGDGVSVKHVNMSTKRLDVTKKDGVAVDPVEAERREKVKDAMIHAWSSYEKYAWGHDELQHQHACSNL
ncbi:mannosyl-oligosaccharide 1,2-alpha-mannosidase MNS1-like protein [Tanacetum coccineum]